MRTRDTTVILDELFERGAIELALPRDRRCAGPTDGGSSSGAATGHARRGPRLGDRTPGQGGDRNALRRHAAGVLDPRAADRRPHGHDTKDNDTVVAIVGAAVGALHGKRGLPVRWIEGLTGRTGDDDDGRVFELLDEARALWWPT